MDRLSSSWFVGEVVIPRHWPDATVGVIYGYIDGSNLHDDADRRLYWLHARILVHGAGPILISRDGTSSGLAWSRLLRFRRCLPVHAFHGPQHRLSHRWCCIAFG
jgi:hypothetical protein